MNTQIEKELGRTREMHEFVVNQLAGQYPSDDRRDLFARFLSIAQSHHEAIMTLCFHERLIGSAYALFRPLVEATNRGLFAAFLATREQIEQIKRGEAPYGKVDALAKDLDSLFKTDGLFAAYAGEAWGTMCGFTHGGLEQLSRRMGDKGEIGCHFEQEDVERLLTSSTSVLVRTAIQFLGAMDRQAACGAVSAKYIALYPIPEERW
jgi:hypothetical protein